MVGVAAAELVVEDDPTPGARPLRERLKVVVRHARTAVQQDQRQLAGGLAVTDHAVPRAVAAEEDEALADRRIGAHRDHRTPRRRGRAPAARPRGQAAALPEPFGRRPPAVYEHSRSQSVPRTRTAE